MPVERAFAYLHAAHISNGSPCRWACPTGSDYAAADAAINTFQALRARWISNNEKVES
jgi:hypothetical protein